ncbi:hypothetical protein FRB99_006011 [Tulasnella sp. 403]|nr:hypothetical protein FRB99_006011 [Tulasnella sp. 403]
MASTYVGDEKRRALTEALSRLSEFRIDPARLEVEKRPAGRGGYGEVRRAILFSQSTVLFGFRKYSGSQTTVAVKQLILGKDLPFLRLALRFAREMLLWSKLRHPNILEFKGFYIDESAEIAYFICPWMANGNVSEYLAGRPRNDAERLELVRDTAEGVKYLHTLDPPVCHGDIKAVNVLVNNQGRAVLCDFGLTKAIDEEHHSGLTTSDGFKGSIRWCSPEVLEGQPRTIFSDVWAWALLVTEVMAGKVPYHSNRTEATIVLHIMQGVLPKSGDYPEVPTVLWQLLNRCWESEPHKRISIKDCFEPLREAHLEALNNSLQSNPVGLQLASTYDMPLLTRWRFDTIVTSTLGKLYFVTYVRDVSVGWDENDHEELLVEMHDATTGIALWSETSSEWLVGRNRLITFFNEDDSKVAMGNPTIGSFHILSARTGEILNVHRIPIQEKRYIPDGIFLGSDLLTWSSDIILHFPSLETSPSPATPLTPPSPYSTYFDLKTYGNVDWWQYRVKKVLLSPSLNYAALKCSRMGKDGSGEKFNRVWKLGEVEGRKGTLVEEIVWDELDGYEPVLFSGDFLVATAKDKQGLDHTTYAVLDLAQRTHKWYRFPSAEVDWTWVVLRGRELEAWNLTANMLVFRYKDDYRPHAIEVWRLASEPSIE